MFRDSLRHSGLGVKRTGVGHDFRVVAPLGEEEDAGRVEISGKSGSVLVEVKATTGTRSTLRESESGPLPLVTFFLAAQRKLPAPGLPPGELIVDKQQSVERPMIHAVSASAFRPET